jgi:uncharacterized HAD superfamily protein
MRDKARESDFFLKEYEVIAQSHFSISQRITTFFQYLLAIYAAPFFLLSKDNEGTILSYALLLVGLVATFASFYLYQLRNEAILYARVVNSMRAYHYNKSDLSNDEILYYSVLPTQKNKPSYVDHLQFIWIVLATGTANSSYLVYGAMRLIGNVIQVEFYWYFIAWIILILGHYYAYRGICKSAEEASDMYSKIIGVDIDGVLNEHTYHFCDIANENHTGLNIVHDEIVEIPVHKCIERVTKNIEQSVFLTKEYWSKMPVKNKSSTYLAKIRTNLNYKVHIFTKRDWKSATFNVDELTKRWLECNDFEHDDLTIEKDNTLIKDRYILSAEKKIEFFVEDNLDNAIRLSQTCRIVFLMKQLYNQKMDMPKNIIPVDNWEEIYDWIRKLT